MCITNAEFETTKRDICEVAKTLDHLGFTINSKKSVMIPTKCIEFLGFELNSETMLIRPTVKKCEKIKTLIVEMSGEVFISIRQLAKLIGHLVALKPGVEFATVHYKRLEIIKNKALRANKGQWEDIIPICEIMKQDMDWWLNNIDNACYPVDIKPFTREIHCDASFYLGWGGTCDGNKATGDWSAEEINWHINCKELMGALLCLKSFIRTENENVKLHTDSSVVVSCLRRWGSNKVLLNEITRSIYFWSIEKKCRVTAVHIAGKENPADYESRLDTKGLEWKLDSAVFNKLYNVAGPFDVDLFASRISHQLPYYVSWKNDPGSSECDAMEISWSKFDKIYAFPPFSMLPVVLQKMEQEEIDEMVVILPLWTTQSWWPVVMKSLVDHPILLPALGGKILQHPQMPGEQHPMIVKTKILACKLSGKGWKTKAFRANLQKSLSNHGGKAPDKRITHITKNGKDFVIEGKVICCTPLNELC